MIVDVPESKVVIQKWLDNITNKNSVIINRDSENDNSEVSKVEPEKTLESELKR